MTVPKLTEIEERVRTLAEGLGAADRALPTFGHTEDGARPHVEVNQYGLHYVVVERGQERKRQTTLDVDDLLFWVFQDVSFELACEFELKHRAAGQDFRRILFARQVELLETLSVTWAQRAAAHLQEVLAHNPIDDACDARLRVSSELQTQGHSASAAWRLAREQYPLPSPKAAAPDVT